MVSWNIKAEKIYNHFWQQNMLNWVLLKTVNKFSCTLTSTRET